MLSRPPASAGKVQLATHSFTFDHVYGSSGSASSSMFEDCVSPLVEVPFQGYNATFLSYGHTGSGKTYTMGTIFKDGYQTGVIPQFMAALFNKIKSLQDQIEFQLHVSFIEDSLGGNNRTVMIACVSPADRNVEETLNTLKQFWCDREETTKELEHTLLQDFTDKELLLHMFCSDLAYDKSLQQLKCFLRYTLISDPNSNGYFDMMIKSNPEILKRWNNEVQEVVQSRVALVQFHVLVQLHQIRQNDQLDVSKLVTSLTRGTVRSPLAQCLLICYTSQDFRVVLDNELRLILKLRDMMKGFRASSGNLMTSY
ncbi:unnamed protein product [Lactuca saligna]|uniref:Kinesin motor domain-containing protein n=1 Tax=Lactuca saligna TaxID=75948 RepID=A0AA35VB36_LACSI|nr:unnamed protein product [Lactuca saligna]